VATGLSALAASCLWLWIAPAYAAPPTPPQDAALPNPLSVRFGDAIQLLGYELADDSVHPGETLPVAFYWRSSQRLQDNYSVFIHLVDEDGILQAQRDSYPGAGNVATSEWPAETTLRDVHTVEIPVTARAPSSLRVEVGLYDFATGRRLSVREDKKPQHGDSWTLRHVTLLPVRGADGVPNPVSVNFDDQIALVGFELDRHTMHAGETLGLVLWWQTLRSPRLDYVVFVHLVYPPDAVWAQEDAMPVGDTARTSSWVVGQRVEDRHALILPLDAPIGEYVVEIGLYDPATLDRLPVNLSDKGIVLGQVRVMAE